MDAERRAAIRRNHTGTHLLHWALREVLGEHVKQHGSLVAPDRLRFDFSHYEPVTRAELDEVEDLVNAQILGDMAVWTEEFHGPKRRPRGLSPSLATSTASTSESCTPARLYRALWRHARGAPRDDRAGRSDF